VVNNNRLTWILYCSSQIKIRKEIAKVTNLQTSYKRHVNNSNKIVDFSVQRLERALEITHSVILLLRAGRSCFDVLVDVLTLSELLLKFAEEVNTVDHSLDKGQFGCPQSVVVGDIKPTVVVT